jgi:hypothetical protein
MTASPIKKSLGVTQPSSTTYSRRRGITTGPPPKIIVPIDGISEMKERDSEGKGRIDYWMIIGLYLLSKDSKRA